MHAYQTKARKIPGTDFREVRRIAFEIFKKIKKKSRRAPYVRSAYFKKDKVFLNVFWHHLFEKQWADRMRRLMYFEAAIELIINSRFPPTTKSHGDKPGDLLHRFTGTTRDGDIFYVQLKEKKISGRKDLISIFPEK
jgi:hypothetical protein